LKAYELQGPGGVDAMMLVEKPVPAPGPGQVLVKLKAVTINYRDLLTVKGGYGSRQKFPLVPLSDGAGVVESIGADVTSFKADDRVTGSFFEGWLGGEPSEEKMRCCANTASGLRPRWCARRIISAMPRRLRSPVPG
jgi:NADPH:quinone reductase-like Zn-dependent oxidoreductase